MKLFALLLFVGSGFPEHANLGSAHVRRTGEITLHASVEKVFPLFGPVDEAKWAPGWQPAIKHGGNAEVGTVFTTDGSGNQATWIVSRYDGQQRIMQYTVVFPEDRVVQIDIECQSRNANEARCSVAYAMTALSEAGRQRVDHYTQEKHNERLAHWQMAMNHYFETGTRIESHE